MHIFKLLGTLVSLLLFLVCPGLSSPFVSLANPGQDAATRFLSLRSNSEPYAASRYPKKSLLPNVVLHRRAGRLSGDGMTLHALKVATYIGARVVLENLYLKIMNEAASYPAGATTTILDVEYGDLVVMFDCDQPFPLEAIHRFASTMLSRVMNGEQNFYIAHIVGSAAGTIGASGAFGQQAIQYIMATPETGRNIANEPWAATVNQWLRQKGLL